MCHVCEGAELPITRMYGVVFRQKCEGEAVGEGWAYSDGVPFATPHYCVARAAARTHQRVANDYDKLRTKADVDYEFFIAEIGHTGLPLDSGAAGDGCCTEAVEES